MKKITTCWLTTLILMVTGSAFADDAVRNAVEKGRDRQDIRQDRRALADDQADLDRLSDLVMQYDNLVASNADQADLNRVRAQIAVELRRDLAENKAQTADARKEVAESKRELRSDRRELRGDRREVAEGDATPSEKRELRDDRRDRRDDRRDVRDDKADATKAKELLDQKRELALELGNLQREIDNGGDTDALAARQSELLQDYLALSREEVTLGLRELNEDRRELREDRRETREDRRQGN